MISLLRILCFYSCLLAGFTLAGCGDSDSGTQSPRKSRFAIAPASETVAEDSTFSLTVEIKNVENASFTAFDITFDPDILQFQNALEGSFMNQEGVEDTSFQIALEDGEPGHLVIGLSQLGSSGGVDGSGTLLTMTFLAMNPGTTTIAFSNPKDLRNSVNESVVIDFWTEGTVTVE